MSVAQAQREITSVEFAEWIAFYELEAELMDTSKHESTEEETVAKLRGFAAAYNAKLAARGQR